MAGRPPPSTCSKRRKPALPTLLLLSVSLFLATPQLATASVAVGTYARWPSFPHSLLLEAAEFLAAEDPQHRLFWNYVSSVCEQPGIAAVVQSGNTSELTRIAVEQSTALLPPLGRSVLDLSLRSRAYTAAVEANRQLGLASPTLGACVGRSAGGGSDQHLPAWGEAYARAAAGALPVCSPADVQRLAATLDTHTAPSAAGQTAEVAPIFSFDREFPAALCSSP